MTTIPYTQRGTNRTSSQTISTPPIPVTAHDVNIVINIVQGVSIATKEHLVKVLRPFSVKLLFENYEYIATSPISDLYEVDASAGSAVSSYLYSLADELFWLEERKDNLSTPLLKQLETLQSYLSIASR